jgi:type 1 fimbria pilin
LFCCHPWQQDLFTNALVSELLMKSIKTCLVWLSTMAMSASSWAASTAVLNVSAELVPVSCSVSVDNGGVFAFGNIEASSLSRTQPTALDAISQTLRVACSGLTPVQLSVLDNSVAGSAISPTLDGAPAFGLGLNGSAKIGGYVLSMANPSAGSGALQILTRSTDALPYVWTNTGVGPTALTPAATSALSFADGGSRAPVPLQTLSATLSVRPTINALNQLGSLRDDVQLQGAATLELKYL